MKTIWHWENILKTAAIVLCVATLNMVFVNSIEFENNDIASLFGLLFGLLTGYVSALLCMIKWDLWHFE
jgi:xanthine/uracil permease